MVRRHKRYGYVKQYFLKKYGKRAFTRNGTIKVKYLYRALKSGKRCPRGRIRAIIKLHRRK